MKMHWTPAGISRLRETHAVLRERILKKLPTDRVANDKRHDCLVENEAIEREVGCLRRQAEEKQSLLDNVVPMGRPSQNRRVEPGHRVHVRYLDPTSKKERGEEESFILGGPRESDSDSTLRTYSCVSVLGKAVLEKRVGEKVTIRLPEGGSYKIEILEISVAEEAFVEHKGAILAA